MTISAGGLASEIEIRDAYSGREFAAGYTSRRFQSELQQLLHVAQAAAIQGAIDQHRPARLLEIAPGPGRLTRDLRTSGKLVCLEFNEGMIAEGQRVCGNQHSWVRGNGFQLPFGREFDLVYSFRFIRHFHHADRNRLLAEISRVLSPGGCFIMDAVNERVSRPLREAHPDDYPIYDKLYRPEQLRDELVRAGFEQVELCAVQKCFAWQYRSQVVLGPRINWLNRVVIRGLEKLPWRDGLEWIVKCRRA